MTIIDIKKRPQTQRINVKNHPKAVYGYTSPYPTVAIVINVIQINVLKSKGYVP